MKMEKFEHFFSLMIINACIASSNRCGGAVCRVIMGWIDLKYTHTHTHAHTHLLARKHDQIILGGAITRAYTIMFLEVKYSSAMELIDGEWALQIFIINMIQAKLRNLSAFAINILN